MNNIPLDVLLNLWIVRFGEQSDWDMLVCANKQDKAVGNWYTALSNAGLLRVVPRARGVEIDVIVVKEAADALASKQALR